MPTNANTTNAMPISEKNGTIPSIRSSTSNVSKAPPSTAADQSFCRRIITSFPEDYSFLKSNPRFLPASVVYESVCSPCIGGGVVGRGSMVGGGSSHSQSAYQPDTDSSESSY
jgi:hypothetical protein